MTPERIAAIRELHRPKPNYDYTDCGDCYQEYPCELIAALDMLAAAVARAAALEAELADMRPKYEALLTEVDAHDQASSWANTSATVTTSLREAELEAERDQYRTALVAADDLARVLDQEVMPRYMEMIDAFGLGDSVVDPMSRQALDAYRDRRAALAASPAAAEPPAASEGDDGVTPKTKCRCSHLRKTHGLDAAGARCFACTCWRFRPTTAQRGAASEG